MGGGNVLVSAAGFVSYNTHMTSGDMWQAVGRSLRETRERQPGKTFIAYFADWQTSTSTRSWRSSAASPAPWASSRTMRGRWGYLSLTCFHRC